MSWAIALIVSSVSISAVFGYLAYKIDSDNWPLKLLFLLFCIINLWGLISLGSHIANENTTGTFNTSLVNIFGVLYKGLLLIGIFVIAYFLIMMIYKLLMSMRMKKKEEEDEIYG